MFHINTKQPKIMLGKSALKGEVRSTDTIVPGKGFSIPIVRTGGRAANSLIVVVTW